MGPISKLLDSVTEFPINPYFARVTIGDSLISLSPEVVEDLSSDQFYTCNIVEGIRSGAISNDLALLEIDPVNHARWRTTANVVVVDYPTPSERWGHGGRPWSPRGRETPQGLDQRS